MSNNFSFDANCIAVYRLESGALTADSLFSNRNPLTASTSAPTADTTNFKEGVSSANYTLASTQYHSRADSALSSDFPLKSGSTNKTITVCSWVWISSDPGGNYYTVWSKYNTASPTFYGTLSLLIGTDTTIRALFNLHNTSGSYSETVAHGSTLSLNTFYHITTVYRDSDKFYGLYIRNVDGNTVGTDVTGTAINNIGLFSQSDFMLGAIELESSAFNVLDGKLDEVVVFNRVITTTEATTIAKGLYYAQDSFVKLEIRAAP